MCRPPMRRTLVRRPSERHLCGSLLSCRVHLHPGYSQNRLNIQWFVHRIPAATATVTPYYVDDLDSSLKRSRCAHPPPTVLSTAARVKTSHNGQCVTLEPRPRYNMSHRRPPRAGWHACCLYNRQEGRSCPREGSKQAGPILIKRGSGMRLESVGYLAVPDKNKNSPPHKQATNNPRTSGGFFWHCCPVAPQAVPMPPQKKNRPAEGGFSQS